MILMMTGYDGYIFYEFHFENEATVISISPLRSTAFSYINHHQIKSSNFYTLKQFEDEVTIHEVGKSI